MSKPMLFWLIAIATTVSCRDAGTDVVREVPFNGSTLTEIHIDNIPTEVIEMNLSDFFTGFRIIPLETNDSCLIGAFNKVAALTENNIFIGFHMMDAPTVVYRFDQDGRFINSIGTGGRGPGEHTGFDVRSILPDESNGTVTIEWSGYVGDHPIKYDFDGRFLGNVLFPEILLGGFYKWSDDEWFSTGSVTGNPEYPRDSVLILFYNNNGKRTGLHPRTIYPSGASEKYTPHGQISIHKYKNSYKVFSPESDTVYSITKEKLIPSEVIFRGADGMPFNKKFDDPQSTIGKHYLIPAAETESYYLFTMAVLTEADMKKYAPGRWGGIVDFDYKTILIEKKGKKAAYIKLTDDVFGFLPDFFFENMFREMQGHTISFQFDASRFLTTLTEKGIDPGKFEGLTSSPERFKSLTPESNPVLITFRLKENIRIK